MKKIGIMISVFAMATTLMSFRGTPHLSSVIGSANRANLTTNKPFEGENAAFTRAAVAVTRYVVQVTERYTPLLDDAAKTCVLESDAVHIKNKEYVKTLEQAKMSNLD
jgi:hypothetical protein